VTKRTFSIEWCIARRCGRWGERPTLEQRVVEGNPSHHLRVGSSQRTNPCAGRTAENGPLDSTAKEMSRSNVQKTGDSDFDGDRCHPWERCHSIS
jgi:hypothetical protein